MIEAVIFGATDFARVARKYAEESGKCVIRAFVVDDEFVIQPELDSIPLIASSLVEEYFPPSSTAMFIATGYKSMRSRERLFLRWTGVGYSLLNIICPGANLAKDVILGKNNILFPGTVLEPGVRLGNNNVIWSNATISHDALLGDHNFVASNVTLGGGVFIGSMCFLGFSSTVLQGLSLGNEVLLASQSLLTKDAEELLEYRGIPAMPFRDISPQLGIQIS